jgi:hypothetical protein
MALLLDFYSHASEDGVKLLSMFLDKWRDEAASLATTTELPIGMPQTDRFPNLDLIAEGAPKWHVTT